MNPEMMAVLSMRQKEMSYQHLAAAVASSTPTALAHASYLPPSQFAVDPALVVRSPVMAAPARVFGAPQPLAPSVPPPPAFFDAGAKDAMARACYSPLSVGHLPPQPALTANYDQYGFVWHWIAQASSHFALQRQTGHLAVCYAQRVLRQRLRAREEDPYFMGAYDDIYTVQKELQVLGLVCVFIAAKIEEVHPPKAADFGDFISEHGAVSCSADDVVRYEGQLLVELKWNLHPTTVLSWLLFLLAGDASDQPAETMGDFVSSTRVSSVRKDVFATAINLIDMALLDYQSMEFLPSVLAGSAILLADPGLDLGFVAQFLQLEPSLLWECKNWLYVATNGLNDSGRMTTRDNDRWGKVPTEELLFIQTEMPVPSHLAFGLLRSETTVYDYSPPVSNQSDNNTMYDNYPGYATQSCGSPSSCDSYGCYCQEGYPCASAAAPNVYHFKYGWQGSDMGYTSAPTVQRKLHFS